MGSVTPDLVGLYKGTTTEEYRAFQRGQIEELLTHYGPIGEVWIDIPGVLGEQGRREQYQQIARLNPDAVVMLNQGTTEGTKVQVDYAWPTDLMAIERSLPTSNRGYNPWHRVTDHGGREADYYLAGEVCDPVGYEWFHVPGDRPRSDAELLGMRLVARARGANLLLDVPPDKSGVIPRDTVGALERLRKNTEKFLA
jgi:alpha-L-fucosidase